MRGQTKGIPDLPYLHDIKEVVTLQNPTDGTAQPRQRPKLSQREAARHLQAYGGRNDAIDWVMNCVRLIAETAAAAPYHWEKDGEIFVPKADPTNPQAKSAAPQPLVDLFEQPNPYQDWTEFLQLLIIDLLLVGNAYWLKYQTDASGRPLALYRLAPPFVHLQPGPYGVEGYEYKVPGQQNPLELSTEQVVHFRQPNPNSSYHGLGVIQGGARVFDLELALTDTQASYYEKHAMPSAVVQSDRVVPRSTLKKIQTQLKGMIGGSGKAGELLVLEAGLKYESISPTAVEAAFATISNASRDRICSMFHVPLALLGIFETTNLKVADAQRVFDTKTMRPLLDKLQKCISYGLTQAWGFDFVIEYEYVMPAEDKLKLASTFASLPGVTVDEVRKYAGLDPHHEADTGKTTLNLPGDQGVPGATRAGFPDRGLAGEAGRPPKGVNTKTFPKPGQALPAGSQARRPSEGKAMLEPEEAREALDRILFDVDGEAVEVKATPELPAPPPDTLAERRGQQVDALVLSMRREIDNAVHDLERGLLDASEGKAKGVRSRIMDSPAWGAFSKRLADIMERHTSQAVSAAATQEASRSGEPAAIDVEAIAREVVYRPEGLRGIVANFRRSISTRLQRAEQRGDADTEAAIRTAMNQWRDGHSETTALSEVVEGYNEGWLTAYEHSGGSHVYVHDGHDYDEECAAADGQVWTIEQAREARKAHPRCQRAFGPAEA